MKVDVGLTFVRGRGKHLQINAIVALHLLNV